MRKIFILIMVLIGSNVYANTTTQRIPQLDNAQVEVWQTTVYPKQPLKMHRHERDRVVVALSDGVLKVTNDKGQTHSLTLSKDHAYFLTKDVAGELHKDENISGHPIKVMVIELKD